MANEPTEDELLFKSIAAPIVVCELTLESLKTINAERATVRTSMEQYATYLATIPPHDASWHHSRMFMLHLVAELRRLNAAEDTLLEELFKSNNKAAMDQVVITNHLVRKKASST